ncbi:hypothetical protein FDK12_02595 [Arthrobacter sp. NamB2]|uniref:hypothetical protein n=1 Tax=Arthrobacter sp. NamB2 TaxID=2576035 RepID=UPI0010C9C0BA|nr:hypothetical protein [Arthrobacter sp. NamB2]TKV29806.1 hypothetical protein FDK12_02595 [Arthrobacter sp. NamB2]
MSRRLGYALNGTAQVKARQGEVQLQQNVLLMREDFVQPAWTVQVQGAPAATAGLTPGAKDRRPEP